MALRDNRNDLVCECKMNWYSVGMYTAVMYVYVADRI